MSIFPRLAAVSAAALWTQTAAADVPRVVADIAPVHSLVAQVMGELGTPELILPPLASPHDFAMRPSQARALSNADLVVWIGAGLTPWLDRPIDVLGDGVVRLGLLDAEGTIQLENRTTALFGAKAGEDDHHGHDHDDDHANKDEDDHDHDHGHDDHAHDDHGHDHGEDHAHKDDHDHGHDDHGHDHGHDHDHGAFDPHAWLDPQNARLWLGLIAAALSDLDPENAATYAANAAMAQADMDTLTAELAAQIAGLEGQPYLVFHDAYQYFEARFGLTPLGAIAVSDASAPSAARLSELRAAITQAGAVCAFAEPQYDPGIVSAVTEGAVARTAVLDPLGSAAPLGADHYAATLRAMAAAKAGCLSEG